MVARSDDARALRAVVDQLRRALSGVLPGTDAQRRMAPRPRIGWRTDRTPAATRPAAGLVLLYPIDGRPHIVLTERSVRLQQHSGQVSLPGGRLEAGEDVVTAALREAYEEIGLVREAVEVIGRLSPLHIPVSGHVLHPVVGWTDSRPAMAASEDEVSRILEVDLNWLRRADGLRRERRDFGTPFDVPYFQLEGAKLWGATSMVVSELLTVLGSPPDPWSTEPHEPSDGFDR